MTLDMVGFFIPARFRMDDLTTLSALSNTQSPCTNFFLILKLILLLLLLFYYYFVLTYHILSYLQPNYKNNP